MKNYTVTQTPAGNRWINGDAPTCTGGGEEGCEKKASVECKYCHMPVCGGHSEWTLDGIVCDQCVEFVPLDLID